MHGKMVEKEETRAEGRRGNTSVVLDASDTARVPSSDEGGSDEDDESNEDDECVEDDESDEVDESMIDDERTRATLQMVPRFPVDSNEKLRSEVNADAVDEVETGDLPNFDSLRATTMERTSK